MEIKYIRQSTKIFLPIPPNNREKEQIKGRWEKKQKIKIKKSKDTINEISRQVVDQGEMLVAQKN